VICFSALPANSPAGTAKSDCQIRYFPREPTYRLPQPLGPQDGRPGYKRRQMSAGGAHRRAVYHFYPGLPAWAMFWRAGPAGLAVVTTETPLLAGRISNLISRNQLELHSAEESRLVSLKHSGTTPSMQAVRDVR